MIDPRETTDSPLSSPDDLTRHLRRQRIVSTIKFWLTMLAIGLMFFGMLLILFMLCPHEVIS